MFRKSNDTKSEIQGLCQASKVPMASNRIERTTSASNSRQGQYFQNYTSNNSKEEAKSQHLSRFINFHSLAQHSPIQLNQELRLHDNSHQRPGSVMIRSTTNPQLHLCSQDINSQASQSPSSSSSSSSKSAPNSENITASRRQTMKQVKNQISSSTLCQSSLQDESKTQAHNYHHPHQHQQEREINEVVTLMREDCEIDTDGFKTSELEAIGALERELPVEVSFLIRQQANSLARINYLERKIRELTEWKNSVQIPSTPLNQSNSTNRTNITTTTAIPITKNGNFIHSDDSGGEYSRATISDDDELSSLLDQIAKSVGPDRNINNQNLINNQHRANYSLISNQPQQYAIINPSQLHHHHQTLPVFVMGSPIAVAAHPSSISSNVLPGVHFQPEPRYNQYYEDLYVQNTTSSPSVQRHNGMRSHQQFGSSISAIEQLVSQKEKRQIKSQLKSADNWLRMRSSGLCNLTDSLSNMKNRSSVGNSGEVGLAATDTTLPTSSSSDTTTTGNSRGVDEEQ